MFKIRSLKSKFILVITILLSVIFGVSGYVIGVRNNNQIRQQVTSGSIAFSELATKPLAQNYDTYFNSGYFKFKELYQSTLELNKDITKVQFVDVNGKIIFDSTLLGQSGYNAGADDVVVDVVVDVAQMDGILSDKPSYLHNENNKSEIERIFYPYVGDWGAHPFTAVYYVSYKSVHDNLVNMTMQILLLVLFSYLFALVLITTVVNNLLINPISSVSKMTRRISKGRYGERIELRSNDEIGNLALATNKMANTLEQNIKDLKELDKVKDQFVDIAAHNLKIPLNHIKFDVAYLQEGNPSTKVYKKLVEDIQMNYNRLQILSDDLINITSLKQGFSSNIFMPADFSDIIEDSLKDIGSMAKAKGIVVHKSIKQKCLILADASKLKQAVLNLIVNAVKYSRNDGEISVFLREKGSSFEMEIRDHGFGIAASEVNKLFTKFYRAPSSAQYVQEGAGLGLYLAKLIVEVHRGNIWVESKQGEGSSFFVSIFKRDVFKKL